MDDKDKMTTENKDEEKEQCCWLPLESDPIIMTDYLRSLTNGSTTTITNDRYLIDIPSIDLVDEMGIFEFHNIIAYIFLFTMKTYRRLGEYVPLDDDRIKNLFFMRQFVQNSCGSVALFHAYINTISSDKLITGNNNDSLIGCFFQENRNHTPEERGHSFASNQSIKQLHHNQAMIGQSQLPTEEQLSNIDYHYVAFVPYNGQIFELDGRQSSPILHSSLPSSNNDNDNFQRKTLAIIKQYMLQDPDSLQFSLLALCSS